MNNVIKINGEWIPEPNGDLNFNPEKISSESETEAGTTLVAVTRRTKLSISGSWRLSAAKIRQFREYREADTVEVSVFYPDPMNLSTYTCQFEMSEKHITKAFSQIPGGLYEISVTMKEL